MWSRRDPDARKSAIGNLFVKVSTILREFWFETIRALFGSLLFLKGFLTESFFSFLFLVTWQNLPESIDNAGLQDIFKKYGNILSSKVVTSEDGKSKGYGFVQFESEESSKVAIEKLNGYTVADKELYVKLCIVP